VIKMQTSSWLSRCKSRSVSPWPRVPSPVVTFPILASTQKLTSHPGLDIYILSLPLLPTLSVPLPQFIHFTPSTRPSSVQPPEPQLPLHPSAPSRKTLQALYANVPFIILSPFHASRLTMHVLQRTGRGNTPAFRPQQVLLDPFQYR
jgi:hypothetical protein